MSELLGNGKSHGHTNGSVRPTPTAAVPTPNLVGSDRKLRHAIDLAVSIAPTTAPVLLIGEPGTGKSLLARSVLVAVAPRSGPFLAVDCSALHETQLEHELFGVGEQPGRLAQAEGGTLLLDEVAALSAPLQLRLARLLEDGEYEPAGSGRSARADVRLIFTSRVDLADLTDRGTFRQDLYYRMSVVTISLPPLRERGDDVERLADHFRSRFARAIGKTSAGFSLEALETLRAHSWPGNVLELENVVERSVVVCRGPWIEPVHVEISHGGVARLPRSSAPSPSPRNHVKTPIQPLKEALEGPERQLILQALEALNWNRQETARVLDINRTTLYKKMKKYGLLFDEPAWAN